MDRGQEEHMAKQLEEWRCIARPHLGMMFQAIKLLEPAHVDMLWRMYNIDHGLIVQEVSKGSNAEILGIQKGDVIESINGKPVSTTIELENTLMITCKGPSGAEVHISVVRSKSYRLLNRLPEEGCEKMPEKGCFCRAVPVMDIYL
ncbi:hypothetical protein TRIUR3_01335 [Triticum urartu]|uniref:Uncharacterized protein n=1 Tax=Triticum urartu TaxID=4572 RepID=M7ZFF1_TRIUA|nr:hypothetical protein TRIUR3_01335 [Triticum urartu]